MVNHSSITKWILFLFFCFFWFKGQTQNIKWYSETEIDGITIQNSLPKGGPYLGPTPRFYNYSYLVFFTHLRNGTDKPLEINMSFSADSMPIPNSPNTFVKLFLPPDTMTLDKYPLFSYGITELESLDKPTQFRRILQSQEDCALYVVAIFYQTDADAWEQKRGGNRAELVLKGQDLFYNMPPQIPLMPCGKIVFQK